MNKKDKMFWCMKNNGITLISLVITIVVMLILAGVAVSITVDEGGLFEHSQNASQQWDGSVTNEQIAIDKTLNHLPSNLPEGWESSKVTDVVIETSIILGVEKERKAPIPVGYIKSGITSTLNATNPEDTIAGGLVVYQIPDGAEVDWAENEITLPGATTPVNLQENVNQFVWIPVDDINDMVMCKKNGKTGTGGSTCNLVYDVASNEIICQTHGYSTATELSDDSTSPNFIDTTGLAGRLYATDEVSTTDTTPPKSYTTNMAVTEELKVAHRFEANSRTNREPDLITTKDNSKYQLVLNESLQPLASANELKQQLNNKFTEMAKSVAKYGGFYVSRYEAGANGASLKNQKVLVAGTDIDSLVSGCNSDTYINGNLWYGIYNTLMSSSAVEKTAVNSHMIWGCQYDQIIKFLSENTINGPQIGHTTRQSNVQKLTGESTTDVMSNIYDLEGNNYEMTAQANWQYLRVARGSYFGSVAGSRSFYPASYFYNIGPDSTKCYFASRSVVYVK